MKRQLVIAMLFMQLLLHGLRLETVAAESPDETPPSQSVDSDQGEVIVIRGTKGFVKEVASKQLAGNQEDSGEIKQLILQLDSDNFQAREEAEESLTKMVASSDAAAAQAIKAATQHDSPEIRMRAKRIYNNIPSPVKTFQHNWIVPSVAFSRDGKVFATASRDSRWNAPSPNTTTDNSIRLWDVDSGKLLAKIDGHEHWGHEIEFSPTADQFVTASYDRSVKVWDYKRIGTQLDVIEKRKYRMHHDAIYSVAYSPDGRRILTGAEDSQAYIVDIPTGKLIRDYAHDGAVYCGAFLDSGNKFVTGTWKGTVGIWDANSRESLAEWRGHEKGIIEVAVSPNRKTLVTTSFDHTAIFWDLESKKQIGAIELDHWVFDAVFSVDGRYVATCHGHSPKVFLWDTTTFEKVGEIFEHSETVSTVAMSPDGIHIATGANDHTAKIFKLADVLDGLHK